MKTVELLQAFMWMCDECGCRNFETALAAEMSEDELIEAKKEMGLEPWQSGELCYAPDKVKCKKCETEYAVE